MIDGLVLDKQIPNGFTDLFLQEAACYLWLTDELRGLFSSWGYAPVIPPTVAYAEMMSAELGSQMAQSLYRFIDREGRALALRADLTVPVARIVGTRLYDQPMPLRLFYTEHVFRHITPQAGLRREFIQAGVELVGADTPLADAEVVALAAEALHRIGVQHFRLTLGQMGFFRSLLEELDLAAPQVTRLKEAIDQRNDAFLAGVLDGLRLAAPMARVLRALPSLAGGGAKGMDQVIERARRLAPIDAARRALDRLAATLQVLSTYGLDDVVLVDLGEVRGMEYYTGLVFQGYAARVGVALCSGGRYDDLIGHFGPALPAVGFAMDVGLARLAVEPPVQLGPDLIVEACAHRACYLAVRAARERGLDVVIDTMGRGGDELVAYARSRGARAARCAGPGVWLIAGQDEQEREIDAVQFVEEIAQC
jgi:ATP phosphoribosyltransferase regulatory subunit